MTRLGENQRSALEFLLERRGWSPGCGWIWGNYSSTVRILDSLVRRGLAEEIEGTWKYSSYQITEAGKQEVFAHSNYYRLKYAEETK